MINTNNVCKAYKHSPALNNVSINVSKGSIYGLVGSNGAGKTTLLKLLSGIYKQDSGDINIFNESVYENIFTKSKIAFVSDNPYFLPQYSIKSMAAYYSRIYESWSFERFEKLKEVFKIDTSKLIKRLSKGTQRQIAFWLTLSITPEIMILDEPFDGLDPIMRQKIKNLIIQDVAERQMTVLISSHNLRELEDFCDSVCIIHKGNVLLESDLDNLKTDAHKIQAVFNKKPDFTKLNGIKVIHQESKGSIELLIVKGDKTAILNQLSTYSPVVLDILPMTLEEIFTYEMEDVGYEIKDIIL